MPIVRILLVLLALASPALAQDGARDAAAARDAAQAFRVYVEGVTKTGGRPDLTRPEVAALLGRVFDLDALNALPPAQANDILWLIDWMEAANATNKLLTRYGSKPGPQPDLEAIQRNMTEYEDQYAAAMNFLIRGQAREAVSSKMFMAGLAPEQRTRVREEGLARLYKKITNETRKKEWLAVRVLLNEVLGFWPNISYMETGKPILNNHARHLSISHSKEMVGILLSTSPYAGIDIEKTSRNIDKVLNRFLSDKELKNIETGTNPYRKIIHWCAKEAIFKSVNEPNIDFSSQILIKKILEDGTIQGKFSSEKKEFDLDLNYMIIDKHMIVWTT